MISQLEEMKRPYVKQIGMGLAKDEKSFRPSYGSRLWYIRAVVRGSAGVFRTDDRKSNRQSITISTLRFENLTTALYIDKLPHF